MFVCNKIIANGNGTGRIWQKIVIILFVFILSFRWNTMQLKKIALLMSVGALLISAARAEPETVIEVSPAIPAAELKKKAAQTNIKLKEVRKKIQTAQKDLKTKQVQQQRAKQIIAQTQIALEKARAELAALDRQQKVSWDKLLMLQKELARLETEVTGTKAQIARLLVSSYKNRQPEAVILFFKNVDIAQKGRLLQYSRYISQANDRVLKQLVEQQAQLEKQEEAINTELTRLKKLVAQQQAKLSQLSSAHQAALANSRKLSVEIEQHNRQINQLRTNERNLNNVLAQISAKRRAQNRAEAAKRKQAIKQRARNDKKSSKQPTTTPTPRHSTGLSRLQGQLRRPISGKVTGRFGQARPSGGTWRGIFIETTPKSVQSIAAGEVAYAAHLNGYGNTVIIDHGEGYLSIYTGLSNINVAEGSKISPRQTIGTSGTLPAGEQGLYFEIRYRNRAMNPFSWIR